MALLALCIVAALCSSRALLAARPSSSSSSAAGRGSVGSGLGSGPGLASLPDPCYNESGHPRRCIPDFVNAAFEMEARASSTCGSPPSRYCSSISSSSSSSSSSGPSGAAAAAAATGGGGGSVGVGCRICDSSDPRGAHPPSLLTDLHNPHNATCWLSEAGLSPGQNVTLVVPLGLKYEVTFVSVQFCTPLPPDSLAIYKSMDRGKTWVPFHFYSSQCRRVFGRPHRGTVTKMTEQEALCTDAHLSQGLVAFSTLDGRPSANDFANSPVLQDWVTATDIKVVLVKPWSNLAGGSSSSSASSSSSSSSGGVIGGVVSPGSTAGGGGAVSNELADGTPPESRYHGVADIQVGGRCRCNGHASRCGRDRDGAAACECRHNTGGPECDSCRAFHHDRPWQRATSRDAHECVACRCNLHASRCRFNMELYKLSGRTSGGVCLTCRHNTAGRHCHYCKEGFFRDLGKAITDRKACRPCDCHPVGSSGKTCNQTSGQCPCKDGVTGLTCNRCARDYQQSRSPVAPCIRIPHAEPTPMVTTTQAPKDCDVYCKPSKGKVKITLQKYCKKDYALHLHLVSPLGGARVDALHRRDPLRLQVGRGAFGRGAPRGRPPGAAPTGPPRRGDVAASWRQRRRGTAAANGNNRRRARGKKQEAASGPLLLLLLSTSSPAGGGSGPPAEAPSQGSSQGPLRTQQQQQQGPLVADRASVIVQWRDAWARRLRRFHRREKSGKCGVP
ncbi:netrin-1-like [Lethenteron reissneri]|uniref:netrin-1-like n=1 Tax=Lethenteron reissneri TaxID=7753 RepID=UPI002AB6E135|nr:netrin-1-like [Lethenteron reissneri]